MASILVVDDDAIFREAVRAVLETEGFEVTEVCDGDAALKMMRQRPADLIICDMFMPGKDGLETLRELHRQFPKTPVIAVSGGGSRLGLDVLSMAKHFGAAHVIDKPPRRGILVSTVRELLAS